MLGIISKNLFVNQNIIPTFDVPERRYFGIMIIINVKEGESLDKALKRFKKKFEKTGVLRELRSRQAFEKKSVSRRHEIKHAIYKQNMNLEPTV
jgi:small subunit ribosomal protein S21